MDIQVSENPVKKNRKSTTALLFFSGILISAYLTANIMAVKLINFNGITFFDAGTLTFPITYIIGDIITEIWGFKMSRKIIFITFFANIFLIIFTTIAMFLPSPDYMGKTDASFNMIFAYVPRIVFASLIAFLVGELLNAFFMEKIRDKTGRKFLWVRTIGSSIIGYIFDSAIFSSIAFFGTVSVEDLIIMIAANFTAKMLIEIVIGTPIDYLLLHILRKNFNISRESLNSLDD
ncbi:MAG: queuosine precursor transporter [Clostridiales Family XIII bacterium]|jgi:uncharacterized integral membrane protein (TIGR00697 family)|nr:queuosine precursor transporter [Clostridiales Family XIII bacterium]